MTQEEAARARRIVDAALRELGGRKGFDDWFDNIDDDIQDEIKTKLRDVVANTP